MDENEMEMVNVLVKPNRRLNWSSINLLLLCQ